MKEYGQVILFPYTRKKGKREIFSLWNYVYTDRFSYDRFVYIHIAQARAQTIMYVIW